MIWNICTLAKAASRYAAIFMLLLSAGVRGDDVVLATEKELLSEKLPLASGLGVPYIIGKTPAMSHLLSDRVRARRIFLELLRSRRSGKVVAMAAYCLRTESLEVDLALITEEQKHWETVNPQTFDTKLAISELRRTAIQLQQKSGK